MNDILTSFGFHLSPSKIKFNALTDTAKAFVDFLSEKEININQDLYSLSPMRRSGGGLFFEIHTRDTEIRKNILDLMMNGDVLHFPFLEEELLIEKITVNNTSLPRPKAAPEGMSIRLRFVTPIIFESVYPDLETIYQEIIDVYSGITENERKTEFVKVALKGISTPHFDVKMEKSFIDGKLVSGFKGSILLVVENEKGLDMLTPAIKSSTILGIGRYTYLGFGRVTANFKGNR